MRAPSSRLNQDISSQFVARFGPHSCLLPNKAVVAGSAEEARFHGGRRRRVFHAAGATPILAGGGGSAEDRFPRTCRLRAPRPAGPSAQRRRRDRIQFKGRQQLFHGERGPREGPRRHGNSSAPSGHVDGQLAFVGGPKGNPLEVRGPSVTGWARQQLGRFPLF